MASVIRSAAVERRGTRQREGARFERARVLHLEHAARSAGEAFAFRDEAVEPEPGFRSAAFAWVAAGCVAAGALFFVF